MKCHSLRDAIVELARGREAGPGTTAAIESHVEHCVACAALMTRERQLSRGLMALADATADDGASDALERRLLEVFAERQSTPRPASEPASEYARRSTGWLRAAAAILLTGAAAALWWSARSEPAAERASTTGAAQADARKPEPAPAPGVALTGDSQRTTPVVAAGHRPRAVRSRPSSPVVRPLGFVELPGAAGLPDFESGQIIRMEIPLTSLPTYGLEILPDAKGSPVKADLLVGQDGQARAIRLVTTSGSEEN
jgi:hypothetical protein